LLQALQNDVGVEYDIGAGSLHVRQHTGRINNPEGRLLWWPAADRTPDDPRIAVRDFQIRN
jgi:hypothetical protein